MIKHFTPQPYDGLTALPDYVTASRIYTLVGYTPEGYTVTLARMTVGDSKSAGALLTHALFESFDDHGAMMKTARTRVSGHDRKFIAAMNAMALTGVEFSPLASCSCEELFKSLGDWFTTKNPDLLSIEVVSQTCH